MCEQGSAMIHVTICMACCRFNQETQSHSLADQTLLRELPMVAGHNQGRVVRRIRAQ
jgi:hypothetical protein